MVAESRVFNKMTGGVVRLEDNKLEFGSIQSLHVKSGRDLGVSLWGPGIVGVMGLFSLTGWGRGRR